MDHGLGLPTTLPDLAGDALLDWARAGEQAGFHTLASLDRLVYHNYDCLLSLAAAAAVTSRIRLATTILLAPLHASTALLAKQAATLDRISAGRFALGLAAGSRLDDFTAAGTSPIGRGARMNAQIEEMRRIWTTSKIGPAPVTEGGPELILGGHAPAALNRVARHGTAWICGAGGPQMFARGAAAAKAAWTGHGRSGGPRTLALLYFSLGRNAREQAETYLRHYYGFAPPYAEIVLRSVAVGEDSVAESIKAYEEAGCDELIFLPCSADLGQLDTLGAVAGG